MHGFHVAATIIRKGDKIFATQCEDDEHKDKWEFPGGSVEPGESAETALIRDQRRIQC